MSSRSCGIADHVFPVESRHLPRQTLENGTWKPRIPPLQSYQGKANRKVSRWACGLERSEKASRRPTGAPLRKTRRYSYEVGERKNASPRVRSQHLMRVYEPPGSHAKLCWTVFSRAGDARSLCECLSRMMGNYHVRFLGRLVNWQQFSGRVTAPAYPLSDVMQ